MQPTRLKLLKPGLGGINDRGSLHSAEVTDDGAIERIKGVLELNSRDMSE
jgi:hypothetical protein